MPKLLSLKTAIAIFLCFMSSFMNQSCSSARTLTDFNPPTHDLNLNHSHLHKITFLMPHVLNTTSLTLPAPPPPPPSSSSTNNDFPFPSKPQAIIPSSESSSGDDDQTQTLDLSSMGFLFPTKATIQDLELRKITLVQQELLRRSVGDNLDKVGKAEGVYVNYGSSYMMALSVSFGEDDDDGDDDGSLRLFGEQRSDVLESHVAVIGGSGKDEDANGYASVKVVERVGFSQQNKGKVTSTKLLSFDVYLI